MEIIIKGRTVIIDDTDYDIIKNYTWNIDSLGYVRTDRRINGKKKCIRMHRLILGIDSKDQLVDHVNRVRTDNRRCNLRLCTKQQNSQNTSKKKNASSKYLGVYVINDGRKKKWCARCQGVLLGKFYTEEEAAISYDNYAKVVYGNFVNANFK